MKRVTIHPAWIGFAGAILAAIIVGILQFCGPPSSEQTIAVSDGEGNQLLMIGTAEDVTINYNVPNTAASDAIEVLEERAEEMGAAIQLTREELLLLSRALRDLDQRTSGLQKLPDGRSLFGHIISGEPTIVIAGHEQARRLFEAGDNAAALEYSTNAIDAYEEAEQVPHSLSSGDLPPQNVAKLYMLGAVVATEERELELALEYAEKAVAAEQSPKFQAVLAVALHNIGRVAEAIEAINAAITGDPGNQEYQRLREAME